MKHPARSGALVALLWITVLSCSDDGTGPDDDGGGAGPLPDALTLVDGNGQQAVVGTAVPEPLVVMVADSTGAAIPGVVVSWTVTSGGGSLAAELDTTDAQGLASTLWTLGTTAGANSAAALTAGLPAIAFTATGLPDRPALVTLSTDALQFDAIGDTARITANVVDRYGNAVAGALDWSSANTDVATVDDEGLVTSAGRGSALLTVIADTARAEAEAHVDPAAARVEITPQGDTLNAIGDTVRITATVFDANDFPDAGAAITWSSLAPGVASVDGEGDVASISTGTARIVAQSGVAADTIDVLVRQIASAVTITPATLELIEGDTARLAAAAVDSNGVAIPDATFDWSASAASIDVDDAGLVRALATGTADAIATAGLAEGRAVVDVADNLPPVAAAPALQVDAAAQAMLDASPSTDPEGRALTYAWTQVYGEDVTGGTGVLGGATPSFAAPARVGTLVFELVVDDGFSASAPVTVQVDVMEDAQSAFFVSPQGDDTAAGTRAAPLATIGAAIVRATDAGNAADVYVAAGDYAGTVTLASGVSIYGGYDASTWLRDVALQETIVTGGTDGVLGLSVSDVTVDGLTIISADATSPGASSYGVILIDADAVTLAFNRIFAGSGAAGADGATGDAGLAGGPGQLGQSGCEDSSGLCSGCSRPLGGAGGFSPAGNTGGRGGDAGHSTSFGSPGASGLGPAGGSGGPGTPDGQGGWNPPLQYVGMSGGFGTKGSSGAHATNAETMTGPRYAPSSGGTAGAGSAGSGGGGGGGGGGGDLDCDSYGGGGAGGGGGGSGGRGGAGGSGGGGSFGVYVYGSSNVVVSNNAITTADGGAGGDGGLGGPGGTGGMGAAVGSTNSGCFYGGSGEQDDGSNGARGGRGGDGGPGGDGGGGGGGASVGIVDSSTESITVQSNTFTIGTGGLGGLRAGSSRAPNGITAERFTT